MYGHQNQPTEEELAQWYQANMAKSPDAGVLEPESVGLESTIRADKDRYRALARQLGILTDPSRTQDYSDRIGALADQIPQGRVTQEQMQDVANKQSAISFLTNPGRSVFYGDGQATDVTPYSIEGNHRFGEAMMRNAAVPLAYADKQREYNKEDLDKLSKVQNLELTEMDKKQRAATGLITREGALQGIKSKIDQDDPNSSMSKTALSIFKGKMDDEIAKMGKNPRPQYRDLAATYAKAKMAAEGKSYSQIMSMLKDREGAFKEAHDMIDQDIKEKNGEAMASVAGARVYATVGKDQREDQKDLSEREIEDFDFQHGRLPTKDAQKKVSEVKAAHDQIRSLVDRMQGVISESGTSMQGMYGKGNELSQTYENLVMILKELQRLGVLNYRDEILLKKQITDPTSLSSNIIEQASGREEIVKQYDNFKDRVTDIVGRYARSKNYDDTRFRMMHGVPDTMREKMQSNTGASVKSGEKLTVKGSASLDEKKKLAEQDQKAIKWANDNPDDPRSLEIKQRLGVR